MRRRVSNLLNLFYGEINGTNEQFRKRRFSDVIDQRQTTFGDLSSAKGRRLIERLRRRQKTSADVSQEYVTMRYSILSLELEWQVLALN